MADQDGFEPPVPVVLRGVAIFLDFGFSVTLEERALKRTGEPSAFDCYQTDTCVCPKQRAGRDET